jgi:two-component system LytT family response regulator/two-component system response regulator LytT
MKEAVTKRAISSPATPAGARQPLTVLIVDDEPLARDELHYLLKSLPDVEVTGQGRNGLEAVNLIRDLEPDLVFLDVQMPGLDGLGVVRRLREKKIPLPQIVFATAYDQYAVQAFDLEAVDYLLKPFDKARLGKAVEKARKFVEAGAPSEPAGPEAEAKLEALLERLQTKAPRAKIIVRTQNRMLMVDSDDIVFATIDDGVITIVAKDLEGTSNYSTIEALAAALPENFWKVHRSYLVNINKIREVVPWFKSSFMLRLDDKKQTQVPVSRHQTKRLRELFKL